MPFFTCEGCFWKKSKRGGNATMASFTNSVSIVLSLICMMAFGMAFIA